MLAVTAFGIVGLTSYWVAQRRRQIGIRRALGATRNAIMRYFQTENLLIAGAGAAIGVALAVALESLDGALPLKWSVCIPAMRWQAPSSVLLLGQAAVLWPALQGGIHSAGIGDARCGRQTGGCDPAQHPLTSHHAHGTRHR